MIRTHQQYLPQVLSLVSSLLMVCYHTAQAYSLHKDDDLPDRTDWSFCQKVRWQVVRKAGTVATFLRCSPLLVTSAFANFGTLTLCIAVEEEFALFYITAALLSNFFVFLLPASIVASTLTCLGMANTLPPPARPGAARTDQHAFFMTWTNLFLMSKTLEDPCFQRSGQMILMQWIRFVVNLATLAIIYSHISSYQASKESMVSTLSALFIVNALNFLFIAVAYCRCSSQRPAEVPEAQEDDFELEEQEEEEEEKQEEQVEQEQERKRKTLDLRTLGTLVMWTQDHTRGEVATCLNISPP